MQNKTNAAVVGGIALVLFIVFYVIGKYLVLIVAIVAALVGAYFARKAINEKQFLEETIELMKELPKKSRGRTSRTKQRR